MAPTTAKHIVLKNRLAPKVVIVLFGLWLAFTGQSVFGEMAMTEQQIKALCLLNFTKYVEWPPEAFPETNSPIRIGIVSEKKIAVTLKAAVADKLIGTHPVEIIDVDTEEEGAACHVLFVGSEAKHVHNMLEVAKGRNVLTVGETMQFAEAGGIITFTKRENKVRFEVNLSSARTAGLQISSKMLNLADAVRGK